MDILKFSWMIPVLPLAAALLIGLLGAKVLGKLSAIPAILAMLVSALIALGILQAFNGHQVPGGVFQTNFFSWIDAGSLHVPVGVYLDPLSSLYLCFVTGIGLLIFIYASGYMKGDFGFVRFFSYLSLFVFFMTCLVMGNNFILLYLGWEGVGLASYLLIGYYYPRPSAVAAAKKAFITNRVGDFGFALGIFLIYVTFGTLNYHDVFARLSDAAFLHEHASSLYWIPFFLMIGAFGKSAQFPLHVWLPDAMEGPTPVSALIHAATMVTAGIYMIARCTPLFHPDALTVVACIGGFTAFMAATIALCQYDLKKIWAYSTVSQLGYMFLGLGVAAGSSAVFHVFTHAFFKALLFLAAGSVMHAMGGELDIRKMSGVRRVMPKTALVMLIGCLALAGFPGLAGFFSKDEILAAAINAPGWKGLLGVLGLIVALMTAYYTFRLFFRVFMGPLELPATAGHHEASPFELADAHHHGAHGAHGGHGTHEAHDEHHESHGPNDGPVTMWGPLLVLALGALAAGYLGVFGGHGGHGGWIHEFLAPVLNPGQAGAHGGAHSSEAVEAVERVGHSTMMVISSVLALLGMAIAAYFHWQNRHAATILARNFKGLVKFLENKWYIDEVYQMFPIGALWLIGNTLAWVDRICIDGLVSFVGFIPQSIGYTLKPTQRGLLQRYAGGMIAGLAAILVGIFYLLR